MSRQWFALWTVATIITATVGVSTSWGQLGWTPSWGGTAWWGDYGWRGPCQPMMAPAAVGGLVRPPVSPRFDQQPLAKPMAPAVKGADSRVEEGKQPPRVIESRSAQGHQAKKVEIPPGPVRVGFWNVTGRGVTLQVDGRTVSIPRDRSVSFELDHQFTWQIDDGERHRESVPKAFRSFEVVIR